jgi:hypothetical protein
MIDVDLAALAAEIEAQQPKMPAAEDKQQPKREQLPAHLPRREIRHEPEDTTLRLRPGDEAHRRRRGREAGPPPRCVQRGAACPRQVGLRLLQSTR